MKLHSRVRSRVIYVALCAISIAAVIVTFRAQADQWDKKTILSVDQPIQITERLLEPGQYVLKLADSNSDRHIVQIFNGDQSHIIDTVLAIPNYRLKPTGKSQFMFWETPPGAAPALRAWFYPGDNFGQEFRYPKHLAMLRTTQAAVTTMPPPEPAAVEPAPPPPEANLQQPEQVEPPVETAQNTPPPSPPEVLPAPAEQQQPEKLPKTASPYPLFGLGGLFSLGLYGLVRPRRRT